MSELYIGLMSGTSLDGIDAGLVDFSGGKIRLVDFHYQAFSDELRQEIHNISQAEQLIRLKDYGTLDAKLGKLFAETALALLNKAKIPASAVTAIGSHGQTVYHAPSPPYGFSLQIGDPNVIAEMTGITTIADFRRRDIAAGGQGAPLAPAFHQALFADHAQSRVILNIGGIANITVLGSGQIMGFDTGPGNTLMNLWCERHLNQAYDQDGAWAAGGQCNTDLLASLLDDDYFRLSAPKSTGKEYFSPTWLENKLKAFPKLGAQDVQASLCQLTANTISEAIKHYAPQSQQVLVCGGGVHNKNLLKLLRNKLNKQILSTATLGVDPDHVEAIAFAWLAKQTFHQQTGSLCEVTGAHTPVVLGGIYPGKNAILR